MKAVRVHEYGGPGVLRYEDVEVPRPRANEALVKIAASGVNYLDVQYRTGRHKTPTPFTIGSEGAGVVADVGADVADLSVGDRVGYAMTLGSYAEYAVVPAWKLVAVPPAIELETAAAVMLQGLTAHYLTHSTFPLKRGDTALVHAGAGGVGQAIVQVAHLLGARVIATAGTDAKAVIARAAGADEVIVYTRDDFEAEVKRLTGGAGVDVVYDSVGRDTFDKSLNCLRPRGYLVLFGFSSGQVAPFDPATLGVKGSIFLTRPGLNQYMATRDELLTRANAVFTWLMAGTLRVRIDRRYSFADARQAHEDLEARRTAGKLVLTP
ncbi:MAG TPA: quinone oxidoreductase [Vicinamibacterales bacterium]|nr:quinone oxidoreductase [Vicinamibacterales bacterium]